MKALLCKQFGPPEDLVIEDVPPPQPGPGQVAVRVKAAALNFPDTLIVQGKYQYKPPFPFSPGSELAGVVARVGEGVTRVRPGDRVAGFSIWGAFAEEALLDADRLMRLPEAMDFTTGAAFVLSYGTVLYALQDRARLQPGETLLVLGAAGGVGTAAIEVGRALGARVIACASSAEKLALCRRLGAEATIDYRTEDLRGRVKALTDDAGPDVIFDPVGGALSEPALRSIGWNGRFLVMGFAAGEIPRIPLNLALLKNCAIIGVFWGEFTRREAHANQANLHRLAQWHRLGKLAPVITETVPLAGAARALARMARREITGKVVVDLTA